MTENQVSAMGHYAKRVARENGVLSPEMQAALALCELPSDILQAMILAFPTAETCQALHALYMKHRAGINFGMRVVDPRETAWDLNRQIQGIADSISTSAQPVREPRLPPKDEPEVAAAKRNRGEKPYA